MSRKRRNNVSLQLFTIFLCPLDHRGQMLKGGPLLVFITFSCLVLYGTSPSVQPSLQRTEQRVEKEDVF